MGRAGQPKEKCIAVYGVCLMRTGRGILAQRLEGSGVLECSVGNERKRIDVVHKQKIPNVMRHSGFDVGGEGFEPPTPWV